MMHWISSRSVRIGCSKEVLLLAVAVLVSLAADLPAEDPCAVYEALLQAGEEQLSDVEDRLRKDRDNPGCALRLARTYLEAGREEKAIRWINFTYVFVDRRSTPELFAATAAMKLQYAPDSPLELPEAQGELQYNEELQYNNAEVDYEFLKNNYPEIFKNLTESAWGFYRRRGRSVFWTEKFANDGTFRIFKQEVQRLRGDFSQLRSRRKKDGIFRAYEILERLNKLGEEVSDSLGTYRELVRYFKKSEAAKGEHSTPQDRVILLKEAQDALKNAKVEIQKLDPEIENWDPEEVGLRYGRNLVMSELEKYVAAEATSLPSRERLREWKQWVDHNLSGEYQLDERYLLTLELLLLLVECRSGDEVPLSIRLYGNDPCHQFTNKKLSGVEDTEMIGRTKFIEWQRKEYEAIEGRIDAFLEKANEFLTHEKPTWEQANSSEESVAVAEIRKILTFLAARYEAYPAKQQEIRNLSRLAELDELIATAPRDSGTVASEWQEWFSTVTANKEENQIYEAALVVMTAFQRCIENTEADLVDGDACHQLASDTLWSSGPIRRGAELKDSYQDWARTVFESRVEAAIGEIVSAMGSTDVSHEEINERLTVIHSEYEEYITDSLKVRIETAMRNSPNKEGLKFPWTEGVLTPEEVTALGETPKAIEPGAKCPEGHELCRVDIFNAELRAMEDQLAREYPLFRVGLEAWRTGQRSASMGSAASRLVGIIKSLRTDRSVRSPDILAKQRNFIKWRGRLADSARGRQAEIIEFHFLVRFAIKKYDFSSVNTMLTSAGECSDLPANYSNVCEKMKEMADYIRGHGPS